MQSQFRKKVTQEMTRDIKGFNLCAFLIGLEGWRRGLKLTYYGDINVYSDIRVQGKSKKLIGRNYSLESSDKIHYFNQSRGDLVSNEAVRIAQSKQKTKSYLKQNYIPIMESIEFSRKNPDEDIIKAAEQIGYPVIIKPTYGTLSKGVVLNIKNSVELIKALIYVRTDLGFKSIMLERYFEGDDIRLYVVNDEVVAGLKRLPARITGDGKHTIRELIEQKNESRKGNPYLEARPIKIDDEVYQTIKKNGYEIYDTLENDKTILVKHKSTMNQGVELYDITDELPGNIKQIGIDALKSLPDIIHGSIDLMYDGKSAVVLEINPSANISMHMFPNEGQPRNIGAFLMDLYFPETKRITETHYNLYFDYLDIVDILKRNYTNYIEIKSLPDSKIHAMQYIISGKVQNVGYRNWIKREAIRANLHGFTRNLLNGDVEVVVGSEDIVEVNSFYKKCKKGPKSADVEIVKRYEWDKEIKIGFELKGKMNKKRAGSETEQEMNELIAINYQLKNELASLQKETNDYKQKYESLEKTVYWLIVKPIEKIMEIIRKTYHK